MGCCCFPLYSILLTNTGHDPLEWLHHSLLGQPTSGKTLLAGHCLALTQNDRGLNSECGREAGRSVQQARSRAPCHRTLCENLGPRTKGSLGLGLKTPLTHEPLAPADRAASGGDSWAGTLAPSQWAQIGGGGFRGFHGQEPEQEQEGRADGIADAAWRRNPRSVGRKPLHGCSVVTVQGSLYVAEALPWGRSWSQ